MVAMVKKDHIIKMFNYIKFRVMKLIRTSSFYIYIYSYTYTQHVH